MKNHNSWKYKNVLITGGCGFIGSNLAHQLVHEGCNVTIIDSLIPEYGGNFYNIESIKDSIKLNISDIRDPHSLKCLVKGQDVIFNLAGQTSHMDSMVQPFVDLDINARAQLSLLEVCRQEAPEVKIIFASTRQVYGKPHYLPVDEKHPLNPVDINGINKLAGEWYHRLYHDVYGMQTCCLRLTNIYGPRMRIKDARQTFVGIWINQVLKNSPFQVWGGEQLRDFVYVKDVVSLLCLMGENDNCNGKIYNVGGFEIVDLKTVANCLCQAADASKDFQVIAYPPDRKKIDIGNYYSDSSLLTSETGWQASTSLKDGLSETVAYFRETFDHYQ